MGQQVETKVNSNFLLLENLHINVNDDDFRVFGTKTVFYKPADSLGMSVDNNDHFPLANLYSTIEIYRKLRFNFKSTIVPF